MDFAFGSSAEDLKSRIDRNREHGWPDLSAQEKAFVFEYVIDYDHRRACEEVGMNPDRGIRLIRNPLIAAAILDLQEQTNESKIVTEDFIRAQMLSLIPYLRGDLAVPMVDKHGNEMQVKKFHAAELITLLKDMARSTKFYKDGSSPKTPEDALLEAFTKAVTGSG